MPRPTQLTLLGSIRNNELFSSHWLKNRLPLEPEWNECQRSAAEALKSIVELWQEQRSRVEQYGGEQSLEQAFIQPVLQALGWKLIYQTHLRGRKPDYALFLDNAALDASLQAGRAHSDFWKYATVLADAKAWHVALDRPTITDQQREYPPEQIEWYLNNSLLNYGILTNGKRWRLIPRRYDPGQPRFQTYFECDLASLLDSRLSQSTRLLTLWEGFDDFIQFFLFFAPSGFTSTLERPALVERARTGSSHYRIGVGDGLKQRVFEALRLCIEGFLSHEPNKINAKTGLEECRYNSLVLLYRLLFILYAEDRKLLPYGVDRAYTENRSLGRFRDEIANRLDRIRERRQADYQGGEATLWPDLHNLFLLIDDGAARYNVPPYNGGLFDSEAHPFLKDKVLPDSYLARIIDQLGRAEDRSHGDMPNLVRVDYRDLAIQHLGNLYEGLLELQPHFAHEDMFEIRTKDPDGEYRHVPATAPIPRGFVRTGNDFIKGAVFLLSDKGERKSSGSYYTPNNIVDYIVEHTLGPLCEEIDKGLRSEISAAEAHVRRSSEERRAAFEAQLEGLRGQFAERVLQLRILDPAMGSGHFLIRACQYLAEQIATNPNTHYTMTEALQSDESILTYWKRRVAEICLFGVDRNFMAVELAKLALWLETIAKALPLTFLDHHLRHGDSLVGASLEDLRSLPDAPPIFEQVFDEKLRAALPNVLAALSEIRALPSTDVPQVKQKGKLFQKCEAIRKPFSILADLWCSTFYTDKDGRLTLDEYGTLVERLVRPNQFKLAVNAPRYENGLRVAASEVTPFHWQLEFPEVFQSLEGRRGDAGFDAILGNPPYDVLSEKETGKSLTGLKQFLRFSTVYRPSFVGKNNLYKLFMCRSLSLLAEGGRLGFITPMPLLGDEQAVGIRKAIFKQGAFTAVEAFPQKDNPIKRVFRDAKLSTTIGIVRRIAGKEAQQTQFVARVHPANVISEASPSLKLTASDVSLYDPSNLTVVSCSQADWNLAVRVMQSGRFQRLGNACTSYQGEVNEKTDANFHSGNSQDGQLVLRGSNVTLYLLRTASQGEPRYLDAGAFLGSKGANTKVHHSKQERIGFQRSSPQNTFRRIVACPIPAGEFCFDTISYVPYSECRIPPLLLLALLNSKLLDWYFRLGSTNSKVNEYQFNNLPCPVFGTGDELNPRGLTLEAVQEGHLADAFDMLAPAMQTAPFSRGVSDAIVLATRRIIEEEKGRGEISRHERSALTEEAQPYQEFIDRILFAMAGTTETEAAELVGRLAAMM
jgi:type I restriction-modification system DNA methylase subunit